MNAINLFLRAGLVAALLLFLQSCGQPQASSCTPYALEGPLDTIKFEQAPFEWHITPRHDYSQTYVTKLFLSQAEFDRDLLGLYKMRDNGKQTVYMTFEQALEAIKGMDAITLGLPKIVYLVGWQYNGHDSKYPAFFEGDEALKRPGDADALESMRWLMGEAKAFNTAVSLHINMFDCYDDSPLFDEYVRADVLAKDKDGKLITGDWGYKISYTAEWEKGLTQRRLDSLCRILPVADAGTLHIDAFHNTVPTPRWNGEDWSDIELVAPISPWHGYTEVDDVTTQQNIVKYLDAKGIDVTIEGVGEGDYASSAFDGYIPMYWHYGHLGHQLSLAPSQATGVNYSGRLRCFGYHLNGEQLFRNAASVGAALDEFKGAFCKSTLIALYLNNFERKAMISDEDDNSIGLFADGISTMWKDDYLHVSKDGNVLADRGDVFIPALWLGSGSVVAYSEDGYSERSWTLPEGVSLPRNAAAWTVTPGGLTEFTGLKVRGRTVTLSLAPDQMVVIGNLK